MYKFLKKHIELLLIIVFIILVLACAGNTIFRKDNREGTQEQLQTAVTDYMSNPAVSNISSHEANPKKLPESDFSDNIEDDQIPEGNNTTEDLIGQSPSENIIMEEENSLGSDSDNLISANDQDIDFSRSEDFRIEVDLGRQKVLVYYRDELIREMICSGGTEESQTPLGEYVTSDKIEYDWIERFNMGAHYWTRFYNEYLFHSVPFDKDGNMIEEEYEKLGSPASHGCIRLKLEEAKWLYEKLPSGVKVSVYQEK